MSEPAARIEAAAAPWPRFRDLPEPKMVALYAANGSGTKVYQGFLDGHPELYMVPAYPLMYLYPHWYEWRESLKDWSWASIVDAFCVKHASVIDTRRIPGFDGLAALGENQDEFIAIDEALFRAFLSHLLEGEAIAPRTFVLAVHYAYAFCRGEDLAAKKALVYHIHVHEYVTRYLAADFPDMLVLATVRDPRSNFFGRYHSSEAAVDAARYTATDAAVFRRRIYCFIMRYFYEGLDILDGFPLARLRAIRHEDLYYDAAGIMRATSQFAGVADAPCLREISFGGRKWWGDAVYGMEPMNEVNPRIVSDGWKKRIDPIDWYVFEGLFHRYFEKYGYKPERYVRDGWRDRALLFLAMLVPSQVERQVFADYLKPRNVAAFVRAAIAEATAKAPLKDYTFNAYYRHKWTQRDLRIHRPRRFVAWLTRARAADQARSTPITRGVLAHAQANYVLYSLARYVWAIASYPYWIARRWGVTGPAFLRMVRGRNVLPDALR